MGWYTGDGDGDDDDDVDDSKDTARAWKETIHSNGLIYRWLPLMVMMVMLMIVKIQQFLIRSISIVVLGMTDLIGIVMGESCTFGICWSAEMGLDLGLDMRAAV